ncbi:MAG: hypothetical protein HW393_227 [Dehalococcoidia bacterium]|nr:hypothetical protein [Dehalococcoidia bacterium]
MPRSFTSILDKCLAALNQGETLDACLARYPNHADELRAHLRLAQRLALTPPHQPRPAAQAEAWQQFWARAQDMRLGHKPHLPSTSAGSVP